jgi:hypothetical protein
MKESSMKTDRHEMQKVSDRNFTVNYYEKDQTVWVVETKLNDPEHEIEMSVEINMQDMLITDASIRFLRFPSEYCSMIEKKGPMLKGLKVDHEFSRNAMKLFMGSEGCPNIMSLLNVSVPGILYFYYPYRIKTGAMHREEFDHMVRTELRNACLAHSMMSEVL